MFSVVIFFPEVISSYALKTAFALTLTVLLSRIQQVKTAEDRALEQCPCHLQYTPGSRRAAADSGSE